MKQKPLINYDYKYFHSAPSKEPRRLLAQLSMHNRYILLVSGILLGIIAVIIAQPNNSSSGAEHDDNLSFTEDLTEEITFASNNADLSLISPASNHQAILPTPILNQVPTEPTPAPLLIPTATQQKSNITWQTLTVKPGDTLAGLLARAGLTPKQIHELVTTDKNTKKLTKIFPGDTFKVYVDNQGTLQQLTHEIDETNKLEVARTNGVLTTRIIKLPVEKNLAFAQGSISSSLFLSAQAAGLSDKSTMELASIFGWDIDFALDIREGDSFAVLYEEIYRDGKKLRNGSIVAAEFTNQNKTHKTIRFETEDGIAGYYSPDGGSMRKTFLRTPVEFSRISSKFSIARRHPVLNRIRSHKGVDYAAPTGTPIRATADGKVIFRGTKGGYGKTIVLQHGSKYSTLYAHMSRFANGSRNGLKVRQGQVIGYIGMTGLATGPHLHYEFRVDGIHRNPLTVSFPKAEPLEKKYRADFIELATELLSQLESHKKIHLALSEKN